MRTLALGERTRTGTSHLLEAGINIFVDDHRSAERYAGYAEFALAIAFIIGGAFAGSNGRTVGSNDPRFRARPIPGQQLPDDAGIIHNVRPEDLAAPMRRWELVQVDGKFKVRGEDGMLRSPQGRYTYVQQDGTVWVQRATKSGHVDLAQDRGVEYAGEIQFGGRRNRGQLRYWNNDSGHFVPAEGAAPKANLPTEKFVPQDRATGRQLAPNARKPTP